MPTSREATTPLSIQTSTPSRKNQRLYIAGNEITKGIEEVWDEGISAAAGDVRMDGS